MGSKSFEAPALVDEFPARRGCPCDILCCKAVLRARRFQGMVKITVLFNHPDDPAAFEDYYANTHRPLIDALPDLQRFEAARVVATPGGGDPPYYRIAELWFEGTDQLEDAVGSEEGERAMADLQNFASGGATFLICEVDS
jgi:uncharacterized protein (TIGR02118 family)